MVFYRQFNEQERQTSMKKIMMFAAVVGLCSALGVAHAQQRQWQTNAPRQVPQQRFVPQQHFQQRFVQPRFNNQIRPDNRFANVHPGMQQHFGNVGRHGLPMIAGRFGVHEYRNRSAIMRIPGLSDTDAPMDVDAFIDSVDYSAPLDPLDPCPDQCTSFGAISVSNDGSWGSAWSYPTAEAAQEAALDRCVQNAKEQCATTWVANTNWVVAIVCENPQFHWGGAIGGNSLRSAVANAYRFAIQQRGFDAGDCSLNAAIAADGSQSQLVQQE